MKRIFTAAAGAALAGVIGIAPMTLAQDAAHPAHIHSGLCPMPGDVVAPLADISAAFPVDGTAMAGDAVGAASALPVQASVTTVKLALADIVAADHAIVVHKSAGEMGTYVACGDIGGSMMGEGDLPVALGELNDSSIEGLALLHDNGDGTTAVSVYLVGETGESGEEAAATAIVALKDFAVALTPTEISVGQPVSFAVGNAGPSVHEIVLEKAGDMDIPLEQPDGAPTEIEDIAVGGTGVMTYTFTEPGTYQLACHIEGHFEAGMVTTFEVTE